MSRHQLVIHGMPWPLPGDLLIILPVRAPGSRAAKEQGWLQLTPLAPHWLRETKRPLAPGWALGQRCGIFQENFRITTER